MAKVYFHVDLNAFFASAEVLRDPSLKGKPLVVAGQTRRSVVSTASYEARDFGVHSAMPVPMALKLCPDLLVIEGHYDFYRQLSQEFIETIQSFSKLIEKASIDECYVDVSEVIQRYRYPLDLAVNMQKAIFQRTGLTCSIGVAPSLFLAKMASDMKKPNGITVLRIRDVKEKLWPLPIQEMRGIGQKTLPKVEALGIQTIGDLANYEKKEDLSLIFKNHLQEVLDRAHGLDSTQLEMESKRKSMAVSETLLEDVTDYEELRGLFRSLSKRLKESLDKEERVSYAISIRITYYNFRNVSRSLQVKEGLSSQSEIFEYAIQLFDQYWQEGEPVRLLGITLGELSDRQTENEQLSLFKKHPLDASQTIIDELNQLTSIPLLKKASQAKKKELES